MYYIIQRRENLKEYCRENKALKFVVPEEKKNGNLVMQHGWRKVY